MVTASSARACRLYLITPPQIDIGLFSSALNSALEAGDVACLQLRLKDLPDDAVRRATEALMPICHAHDVAFIMNDRPDLAKELGCDGVHVGQGDAAYDEARRLVGPDAVVGVTCKDSRDLALIAAEAGADYVAFGGFFPSTTKQGAQRLKSDPELLTWWQDTTTVPCVAIGGITVENCGTLAAAGADFLAVISGVWDYPAGPAQAVRDFNRAIAAALPQPAPTARRQS
jgi:thiamine-phosphate pyrophosphorylase